MMYQAGDLVSLIVHSLGLVSVASELTRCTRPRFFKQFFGVLPLCDGPGPTDRLNFCLFSYLEQHLEVV